MALNELLTEYGQIKKEIKKHEDKLKPLNARKDEIRKAFADYLHLEGRNEGIFEDTGGVCWKAYYRKGQDKVNRDLLHDLLSPEELDQVLTPTEFIVIGLAPAKKIDPTDKTQMAPKDLDDSLPPIGAITR